MFKLSVKTPWVERLKKGYPWVYTEALRTPPMGIKQGELVILTEANNQPFAQAYYNPHSKLACRILTRDLKVKIDEAYFIKLFTDALARRERHISEPYYRLVHAEGDHLPGLVIDRFGDTLVCQTSTAGMEKLKALWVKALQTLLKPQYIIFRDNIKNRESENLGLGINTLGTSPFEGDLLFVKENDLTFYADPINGQKTGWFYDQRANRFWIRGRAKGKTVLDLYTYSGGFGVSTAKGQAKHVTFVDSSEQALTHAKNAMTINELHTPCEFIQDDVFALLPKMIEKQQTFDIVLADPPAFVKIAHQKMVGLKGYQKLAKLTAQVVAPNGILMIATCSHHASTNEFQDAILKGITKAGRSARLIRKAGADKDHPINPFLPENHYLKSLAFKLD
jgi:23S rRNA (cytosine1962-C5)-methyltransferase